MLKKNHIKNTNIYNALAKANAKILIQRADRLGDLVLSLPVIESLKIEFPNLKIYLLCSERNINLTKTHPLIDDVIEFNIHKNPSKKDKKKLIKIIKSLDFSLYLSLWSEPYMEKIGYLSKIPFSIGAKRSLFSSFYLTHPIKVEWNNIKLHEINFNLKLLEPINIKKHQILKLYPTHSFDIQSKQPICLFFCNSDNSNTSLSETMLNTVINQLLQEKTAHVVLTYGNINKNSCLLKLEHPNLTNITNPLSLNELISLISKSTIYIGADTGPSHIASFLNKKCIIVFGNTYNYPSKWGPNCEQFKVVRFDYLSDEKKILNEQNTILNAIKSFQKEPSKKSIHSAQIQNLKASLRCIWFFSSKKDYLSSKTIIDEYTNQGWIIFPFITNSNLFKDLFLFFNLPYLKSINTFISPSKNIYIRLFQSWRYLLGHCKPLILKQPSQKKIIY